MESGEILSRSKTPEMETFHTKEIREPVESSGSKLWCVFSHSDIDRDTACIVAGYDAYSFG